MKKAAKGAKGKRHHPYGKQEVVPEVKKEGIPEFKKEWRKNHTGPIQIDGVHSKNEEPKKNWAKKKNPKNLTLDISTPSQRTEEEEEEEAWKERWRKSVDAYYAQDNPVKQEEMCPSEIPNPEMTSVEPLRQLANLVDSIKPDVQQQQPIQPPPIQQSIPPPPVEVNVLEEGEIPEAGNCQYDTLEDLLASVGVCYPCPIHNSGMNEVHSQKEWVQDVFLTCSVDNCPVFTV